MNFQVQNIKFGILMVTVRKRTGLRRHRHRYRHRHSCSSWVHGSHLV